MTRLVLIANAGDGTISTLAIHREPNPRLESPDHCSRPADSDPNYTLHCDEPDCMLGKPPKASLYVGHTSSAKADTSGCVWTVISGFRLSDVTENADDDVAGAS